MANEFDFLTESLQLNADASDSFYDDPTKIKPAKKATTWVASCSSFKCSNGRRLVIKSKLPIDKSKRKADAYSMRPDVCPDCGDCLHWARK